MLQIRSDALAAAAELSLSIAPHCRHVILSDFESDCEEYQSCKWTVRQSWICSLMMILSWTCSDLAQLG